MIVGRVVGFFWNTLFKGDSPRDKGILKRMDTFSDFGKTGLDCGCGNGVLSKKIAEKYDLKVSGIEVNAKHLKYKHITINEFDGEKIPFPDNSFDTVFLMDVVHHTKVAKKIVDESLRVAKKYVIIKDHRYVDFIDKAILRIADWLGNADTGNAMTYNYLKESEWDALFTGYPVQRIKWRNVGIPEILFKVSKR